MPRIRCARMRFYLRNSRVLCLGPLPLPPTYVRLECALLPFFFLPCCPLTRDTCATAIVCMHLIQPIGHVEHVIFDPTHWSANKLSLFARSSLRIACKYLILLWYQLLPYSRVYLHIYFYKKGYTIATPYSQLQTDLKSVTELTVFTTLQGVGCKTCCEVKLGLFQPGNQWKFQEIQMITQIQMIKQKK